MRLHQLILLTYYCTILFYIIILSYQHIMILDYYIILFYHYSIILSYHHIIILLFYYYYIIVLLYYYMILLCYCLYPVLILLYIYIYIYIYIMSCFDSGAVIKSYLHSFSMNLFSTLSNTCDLYDFLKTLMAFNGCS